MIETVINLQGEEEAFDAKKLNHWVKESVGKIGAADWTAIAQETVKDLPKVVTVQKLMDSLIERLLSRETWSHYLMAGRLLAVKIRIEIFGSKEIPTVREVQRRLVDKHLMRPLNYTEYEWSVIEQTINHDLDLNVPHYALEQIRYKYSLQDYSEKLEFETQQFVYMRMAMALFEGHEATDPDYPLENAVHKKRSRLEHVMRIYNHFSKKRLSSPTPNYNNLGTYHKGYASCCLIASGDNRWSLAVADHITYMMTTQSAGIGLNVMCRSIKDAVQKGRFLHRGKKPYIDVFGKNIRANLQGGRGGAGTFYFNLYDPEARLITGLRDTRAVDSKRNRDCHYAYMSNRYLVMKANNEEQVFAWNIYTAPELHSLFYSGDIAAFAAEYERLEQDDSFEKVYFDARELLVFALTQGLSTGTVYAASIDEMNYNTPFLDAIHSSNLCVAPGTIINTRNGPEAISTYDNRHVEVWNGFEWSGVTVRKTSDRAKLLRVYTNTAIGYLDCTEYHKWYILDKEGKEKEVRTHQLKKGDRIASFCSVGSDTLIDTARVLDVEDLGVENSTYCFTEPKRHKAMFNGVVTGQCLEVSEPTQPYERMLDLYSEELVGYSIFEATDMTGNIIKFTLRAVDVLKPSLGDKWIAQDVKVGKQFWTETDGTMTVSRVMKVKREPEVALCSLAAVNVTEEISTDDEYLDIMYYAYKMIDYCILENEYILPHMGVTAKARMNAGVGMMGLATHLARRKLKFNEEAGLQEIHRVFERHMYHAIKASILISKERGLAPWIDRTKWPEGWTPLESYRREIDATANYTYQYDWSKATGIAGDIIDNGGLAHSCLVNFMPGESSSKALAAVNSIYGIREKVMIKVDANNVLRWAAPYSDDPEYEYQSMWDLILTEQNTLYGLAQKFGDQAVSADWYMNFTNRVVVSSSELIDAEIDRVKKGVKTRYYINTLMPKSDDSMKISKSAHDIRPEQIGAYAPVGIIPDAIGGVIHDAGRPPDSMPSDAGVIRDPNRDAAIAAAMANAGFAFQIEGDDDRDLCEGCSV